MELTNKSYVYFYDGSFDGLLTTLALCVKRDCRVKAIVAEQHYRPNLFDEVVTIDTDVEQALKLADYLRRLDVAVFKVVFDNYLSEDCDCGFHLFQFLKLSLVYGCRVLDHLVDDSVSCVVKNGKRVSHEAHKMLGFIRFRLLKENLLYAPIETDFNVIGYCADHFCKRLKNKRWIIHDVKRDIPLYWDGKELQQIKIEAEFTSYLAEFGEVEAGHFDLEEIKFQKLWASFHTAIANEGRSNKKLQRQLMPTRYWKYLTEMK